MDELKLEIKRLIIDSLELEDTKPDDINDASPLFGEGGLGLDSIDALEIGVALRKKYQLQLDENNAGNQEHFQSVNSLTSFVQKHKK
jgi:acyl carrier protein